MLLFQMSELIKISVVLFLILFLLREKMNIGYVMLIASAALFVLYGMNAAGITTTIKRTLVNGITIKLLLALSLIRILEIILREKNILATMMSTAKVLFDKRRAVIISMPLLIGMLPSLGGAYFSAPMVKEATSGIHMSQEEKAFINYWFRHPWEYVLPLYPGILLASAVSNIPLYSLIKANMLYAVMLLATGFLFAMKGVDKDPDNLQAAHAEDRKAVKTASKKDMTSFLPILIVLALVVAFHIELHFALIAIIVPLFLLFRYRVADIIRIARHGFAVEVIILILGIMLFKESMDSSGAVRNLSSLFIQKKVPFLPIICILPFMIGLMTGLTVGFVGSTFPLLISITGDASLAHISLAFAAGFIGVLLSPVHLCLVLTREYFKADLWGIYKKILPSSAIIFIAALLEYTLLSK